MGHQPIRVLCVFSSLDRGGAETMCMNLYRHIDRNTVQFDFVKQQKKECAYESEIRLLGGKVFTAPRFDGLNFFQYSMWWKKFFETHKEYRIIHVHTYTTADIILKHAQKAGITTISHSHSTGVRGKGIMAFCKKRMSLKAGNHADIRLACSEAAGRWLYGKQEFIVLNNAIDTAKFRFNSEIRNEVRKELGLEDCVVIGTVGSFMEVKNPYGIIEITKQLKRRDNRIKLLWIGTGRMFEEIKTAIEHDMFLKETIITLGERNDVWRLMQGMDAFILPSFHEGLPVVTIEAQAAGLHCFCSDRITKEIDITGRCSFLPIEDYSQWISAIERNEFEHTDTLEAIKKAGYDIEDTARWIQDFYISCS